MRELDFNEALEMILSVWPVQVMGWIYSAVRDTVKNVFGIVHRDTSKKIQKMQNLVNLKAKMTQIREKLKILHLKLVIFNKLGLSITKLMAVTIIVLRLLGWLCMIIIVLVIVAVIVTMIVGMIVAMIVHHLGPLTFPQHQWATYSVADFFYK